MKKINEKTAKIILLSLISFIFLPTIIIIFYDTKYTAVALILSFLMLLAVLAIAFDKQISKSEKKLRRFVKKTGLIPKPTEASMFVMAVTLLLLIFSSPDLPQEILSTISNSSNGKVILIFIYIIIGIYLSIYHAFSSRKKTKFEIQTLKWFSVVTLIGVSISTAIYIFNTREFGYIVFATWNALQAILLMFLSGKNHVGEYVELPKREARLNEVTIGFITVLVIIIVNKLIYHEHWSVTFSFIMMVWSVIGSYFEDIELSKQY